MSADYLIGRDVSELRESLRRIEAKLDGNSSRAGGDVRQPASILVPISSGALAVATPPVRNLSGAITWRATDERNCRRVRLPDRSAEIVFFAFMISPRSGVDPTSAADITSIIWPEVESLYNSDTSASQSFYYRPINRVNELAVLGFWNKHAGEAAWTVIDFAWGRFQQQYWSKVWDARGSVVGEFGGWVTGVFDVKSNNYKFNAGFADCDSEIGLGFSFSDFYK